MTPPPHSDRPEDFLRSMQNHVARVAVTASAGRGKGNKGVVGAARTFFREMDLKPFGTSDPDQFAALLDQSTDALLAKFPGTARNRWGLARKLLNIFLRDCLYNRYLSDANQLFVAEHLFELPLDSLTGKKLREVSGRTAFRRWPGVRNLTASLSQQMQTAAASYAAQQSTCRVHFDTLWWGR